MSEVDCCNLFAVTVQAVMLYIANDVLLAPRVAPAVKNLTVLNSTAIVVEWFPINDTREVVIGYTITWQRQGHKRQKMENISDASVTNFVLTGLRKYTNYTISVAAYNSMGAGPDSEMTLVQTDADGKNYSTISPSIRNTEVPCL